MTNHAVYDKVALPDSLWTMPEYDRDEDNDRTDRGIKGEIRAIYYRSDYMDAENYAFAYLGIPTGASAQNKKPAVLLLHGGGGTAFWQWVAEWVNRGYVALAVDLEGHVPKKNGTTDMMPSDLYDRSEWSAPQNQNYGDTDKSIEQTWMYYAVSTAIRGNSLLHGLDYVNKYQVGVCGISWGGVITSIITGYDDRFVFSAPIYCSLNLTDSVGGFLAGLYKKYPAARVWDTDEGLKRVNTPVFLLAMNNDPNAYIDSLSATVASCKNGQIALLRNWAHGHSAAIERSETYAFADGIVKGSGLVKITDTKPAGESGSVRFTVPEGVTVKDAYIAYSGWDGDGIPAFQYGKLSVSGNTVAYRITDQMHDDAGGEVTWFYIALTDSLGRTVSTLAVEL